MYVIIRSGGKQYRVEKGSTISVELLDAEKGAEVEFNEVLFYFDGKHSKVGGPTINGHIVHGKVIGQVTGPKITSVKYKRSHNEVKKFGHRQKYSQVEITSVSPKSKEK